MWLENTNPCSWDSETTAEQAGLRKRLIFPYFLDVKQTKLEQVYHCKSNKMRSYYFCSLILVTATFYFCFYLCLFGTLIAYLLFHQSDFIGNFSSHGICLRDFIPKDQSFHSFCPSRVRTVIPVTKGRREMSAENSRWNLENNSQWKADIHRHPRWGSVIRSGPHST